MQAPSLRWAKAPPTRVALVLLVTLAAGCTEPPSVAPPEAPSTILTGYVLDAAIRPVPNATVTLSSAAPATGPTNLTAPATTVSGPDGGFRFELPTAIDGVLSAHAPGFEGKSQAVRADLGSSSAIDLTLARLPDATPYVLVEEFQGVLRCAIAVAIQTNPGQDHSDRTYRCTDVAPVDVAQHTWSFRPDGNATAIVLEAVWEPQTELSQALTFRATDEAGTTIGFAEGRSPLRLQLGQLTVQEVAADQGAITLEVIPGAGTGEHEHGAAGAFLEQPFELFATTFHDQPAPPTYSITDGR